MFVGIRDALVILFLVFVFVRVGVGVATLPEGFDELLALLVGGEFFERRAFGVRDDIGHVLLRPLPVNLLDLLLLGARAFHHVLRVGIFLLIFLREGDGCGERADDESEGERAA